ncbi:MAG: hypothetical protein EPO40_24230, partial [Myxococcaceae bacterium]
MVTAERASCTRASATRWSTQGSASAQGGGRELVERGVALDGRRARGRHCGGAPVQAQRSNDSHPRQGSVAPRKLHQNYALDVLLLRRAHELRNQRRWRRRIPREYRDDGVRGWPSLQRAAWGQAAPAKGRGSCCSVEGCLRPCPSRLEQHPALGFQGDASTEARAAPFPATARPTPAGRGQGSGCCQPRDRSDDIGALP